MSFVAEPIAQASSEGVFYAVGVGLVQADFNAGSWLDSWYGVSARLVSNMDHLASFGAALHLGWSTANLYGGLAYGWDALDSGAVELVAQSGIEFRYRESNGTDWLLFLEGSYAPSRGAAGAAIGLRLRLFAADD